MKTSHTRLYRMIPIILIVFILINNASGESTRQNCDRNNDFPSDSLNTVLLARQQEKRNTTQTRKRKCQYNQKNNGENQWKRGLRPRSRKRRVEALIEKSAGDEGLQFNGGATSVLQGSLGEKQYYSTATASFDIYAQATLAENTIFFIDLEAVGGNGPDEYFPNTAGMNGDAGSTQNEDGTDRLTVLEVWTEMKMLNQRVAVTTGKIDMTNYFDINDVANDETTQFISGAFINSSAFAMPENSPGIRVHICATETIYLQMGLASADNSGDRIFSELYKIAGIGCMLLPESNFVAKIKMYGYQHPLADNATGWGLNIDQQLFENYRLFARYGKNSLQMTRYWGIRSAWSAGLNIRSNLLGRTFVSGIAYGVNHSTETEPTSEQLLELYGRHQLNQKISLSMHLQHLWNESSNESETLIFGIRTHFNF